MLCNEGQLEMDTCEIMKMEVTKEYDNLFKSAPIRMPIEEENLSDKGNKHHLHRPYTPLEVRRIIEENYSKESINPRIETKETTKK